jgi:NTP pyrophosphatase (non-canonical NTP hydrolase)
MDFDDYQNRALASDQRPSGDESVIIPLLGLAGEAGSLLSEYKKRLRDGGSHEQYQALVIEELGDMLWYMSNLASKHALSLSDIAESNLEKVNERWSLTYVSSPIFFDDTYDVGEQLPRVMTVVFEERMVDGRKESTAKRDGMPFGNRLTDGALEEDSYRFHDAIHLAFATHLGWSPVTRRNTGHKRKSNRGVDETQDGGRAIVIEEAVAAHVYTYAKAHNLLDGIDVVDLSTLKIVKGLTTPFEVAVRTTHEWQRAIIDGFRVFRLLTLNSGGVVTCDLVKRTMDFSPLGGMGEKI